MTLLFDGCWLLIYFAGTSSILCRSAEKGR